MKLTTQGFYRVSVYMKDNKKEFKQYYVAADSIQEASRRKHNRLTQDRMVGILADVARIEDRDVRISILNKIITR